MNNVQLEGNLARDIEISFSKNGMAVARGTVACNRRIKDGDEWKDTADFVPFTAFGALAEGMDQWTKGQRVWVFGRFSTSKYEKDGETRYSSNVIATAAGTAYSLTKRNPKTEYRHPRVTDSRTWEHLSMRNYRSSSP